MRHWTTSFRLLRHAQYERAKSKSQERNMWFNPASQKTVAEDRCRFLTPSGLM